MAIKPMTPSPAQLAELSELGHQLNGSPDDIVSLLRRTAIYFAIEDHVSAIADLDAVIRIDPEHVGARINRANAYAIRNEAEAAIREASFVLGMRSVSRQDLAQAYYIRGRTHAQLRHFEEALSDLTQVLQRVPDHEGALAWRSKVALMLNLFDDCISDCSRVLMQRPGDASTLWRRGSCYARLGKTAEAFRDVNAAIEINPQLERAYVERAGLYKGDGKMELAVADINKALELRAASNGRGQEKFRDDAPLRNFREELQRPR